MEEQLFKETNDWQIWVDREVAEIQQEYLRKPKRMIADFNREGDITAEYRGREILELLQNANDAGAAHEIRCQAQIVIFEEGLCLANTGQPFSTDGINSLMLSDYSPKKMNQRKYIGNKGLGFRSVLNWSTRPFVISGDLYLGFDKSRAVKWLKNLKQDSEELEQEVKKYEASGAKNPVPILAVPMVITSDFLTVKRTNPKIKLVWERALKLRAEGFDTVIGLPFTSPDAYEGALAQLDKLRQEILFLTSNLEELKITKNDGETRWIRKAQPKRNKFVEIITNESEQPHRWRTHSRANRIPDQLLESDLRATPDYEIMLAIPERAESAPGVLFSHFPTQVRFPFPMTCHATLELGTGRDHLKGGNVNRYIVGEIAGFMAEIAEKHADSRKPWKALTLLAKTGEIDPVLVQFEFDEALVREINNRNLIPVHGGEFVNPSNALRMASGDLQWLPDDGFGDVALNPDSSSLKELLHVLEIPKITEDELRVRLNTVSTGLSMADRANLIVGLLDEGILPEGPAPELLIDSEEKVIKSETRTFLTPVEGFGFKLPKWVRFRFLNEKLRIEIAKALGVTEQRELASKLSAFRVSEYSMATVATALVAEMNRKIKGDQKNEAKYIVSALVAIYDLFTGQDQDTRPNWPPESRMQLPTQNGGNAPADGLYLSSGYGGRGALMEALYGPVSKQKLLASPDKLKLDEDPEILCEFLQWLGVAELPREIIVEETEPEYLDYCLENISYPAPFGEYLCSDKSRVVSPTIKWAVYLEELDSILQNADPFAVLSWLAIDEKVHTWSFPDAEFTEITAYPSNVRTPRYYSGKVPSYIHWQIENTHWLRAGGGQKKKPNSCLLGSGQSVDMTSILPRPDFVKGHPLLDRLNIDRRRLSDAMATAGVNRSISELSFETLYSILSSLPEVSPNGEGVRTFYRSVIESRDDDDTPKGLEWDEFRANGMLWGKLNDQYAYFPIDELRYVDSGGIPDAILKQIPILELARRSGARKVQRILGVNPFDRHKLQIKMEQSVESPWAMNIQKEFQLMKPDIYALRVHADSDEQDLRRLRRLEIILCKNIGVIAEYEGRKVDTVAQPWEWYVKDNVCYVLEEPGQREVTIQSQLLADSIGRVLADSFQIERSDSFSRIVACPSNERRSLLMLMIGEDSASAIEQVKAIWEDWTEPDDEDVRKWVDVEEDEKDADQPEGTDGDSSNGTDSDGSDDSPQANHEDSQRPIGPVSASPVNHQPSPPKRRIKFRVRKTSGPYERNSGGNEVADPKRSEDLAMEFEIAEGQDRFPLPTAQTQGYESFVCDVLSFETEEKRDEFKNSFDSKLVERFIEVKGGNVLLKGNELELANQFSDRYFIYQIFEKDDGEFQVSILKDPLSHIEAKTIQYEIDIMATQDTDQYIVSLIEPSEENDPTDEPEFAEPE